MEETPFEMILLAKVGKEWVDCHLESVFMSIISVVNKIDDLKILSESQNEVGLFYKREHTYNKQTNK